jgi:hypothetical protein
LTVRGAWARPAVTIPLPWERVLWSGRPAFPFLPLERYVLTDLRLVRLAGSDVDELLLQDIGDIQRTESRLGRILGASTLSVHARDSRRAPIVLRRVGRGQQLAALFEWLSLEPSEHQGVLDAEAVAAAMAWTPHQTPKGYVEALVGLAAVAAAVFGIVIGLHRRSEPLLSYAPDDPMYSGGHKRTRVEIARYMEAEIMPWARATLGPLKGGSHRITCETCHGRDPDSLDWRMPAVAALPRPEVRGEGWEQYGRSMDAQMRNAIYGYLAGSDKQTRAAYMRELVMPGMARLLRRPPYDFTRPYAYNRSRNAFGCYHCHRVH